MQNPHAVRRHFLATPDEDETQKSTGSLTPSGGGLWKIQAAAKAATPPIKAVSPERAREIVPRSITVRMIRGCSAISYCVVMRCFVIRSVTTAAGFHRIHAQCLRSSCPSPMLAGCSILPLL